MDWDQGHNWVILTHDGVEVARMTLDEWMELGAVRYAAEEITQQEAHFARPETRRSWPDQDAMQPTAKIRPARAHAPPSPRHQWGSSHFIATG